MVTKDYWSTEKTVARYILEMQGTNEKLPHAVSQILLSEIENVALTHKINLGTKLIDIGIGPGTVASNFISKFGFDELLAVDFSKEMLDNVPFYVDIEKTKTTFQCADVSSCMLNAADLSTSLVISCRTLLYIEDVSNVFKEAARVMRSGGIFGFSCFTHSQQKTRSHLCEFRKGFVPSYAHSESGVKSLVSNYGYEFISNKTVTFYSLATIPVEHSVVLLKKK